MSELDHIQAAAAPILAWWAAHEAATPGQSLPDTQCVMYYKGIRVTAGEMRKLKEALSPQAVPAPVAPPQ